MRKTPCFTIALFLLLAGGAAAFANCPIYADSNGCPYSGSGISQKYDGTCTHSVYYGGTDSDGNLCFGVCEDSNCMPIYQLDSVAAGSSDTLAVACSSSPVRPRALRPLGGALAFPSR